jgi:hypothetical protein
LAFALFASSAAALAAGPEISASTKAVAQKVYEKGAEDYKAGRLLEALAAFRASFEMVPSPNSHLMIARTLRDSGELIQAYREYDKLVPEAEAALARESKYAKTADIARAERAKLRAQIALVRVYVKNPPDDLRVVLGSTHLDRSEWETPVPVLSGVLVARATTKAAPDKTEDLVAAAGGEVYVTFDYTTAPNPKVEAAAADQPTTQGSIPDIAHQPLGPEPAADRTLAYVALGVAGAGLLTFAVLGTVNQSTFDDLQAACPAHHCPADLADEIRRGRTEQTIANVSLGVGIASGALATILFAISAVPERRSVGAVTRAPKRLGVTDVMLGRSGVALWGAF